MNQTNNNSFVLMMIIQCVNRLKIVFFNLVLKIEMLYICFIDINGISRLYCRIGCILNNVS